MWYLEGLKRFQAAVNVSFGRVENDFKLLRM